CGTTASWRTGCSTSEAVPALPASVARRRPALPPPAYDGLDVVRLLAQRGPGRRLEHHVADPGVDLREDLPDDPFRRGRERGLQRVLRLLVQRQRRRQHREPLAGHLPLDPPQFVVRALDLAGKRFAHPGQLLELAARVRVADLLVDPALE